ncbi:MAG: radical SAM protein [Clostridia bacterium]|nr:radical SAM protein [Clostridia bacterium]
MADMKQAVEPLIVKYINSKAAKEKLPVNTTFEITSRCNFNCKMCYVHNSACNALKNSELSAKQWIDIAQQAKDAGALFVLITGGEPFFRDDFCEIYEAVAKMGFILSLNTNLSLLNDEILDLLTKYRPNRVNVSLYGTSDKTYSNLCGVPAFETVKENILRLKERGIRVKVNSSITQYNIGDLDSIMDFCEENNIIFKGTGYMFPQIRLGEPKSRISAREVSAIRAHIDRRLLSDEDFRERARRIKAGIEIAANDECPVDETEGGAIRCRAGKTSAWVDSRGNLSYCGMIPAGEDCNIPEKGFAECWKTVKEKAAAVRMPAKCSGCKYKHICTLCAASQICEKGDFSTPAQYVCENAMSMCEEYEKLL